MLVVFVIAVGLAMGISILRPAARERNRIDMGAVSFATSGGFNVAALGVAIILVALYASFW
jgi:SSS family solute:Na+ symporter